MLFGPKGLFYIKLSVLLQEFFWLISDGGLFGLESTEILLGKQALKSFKWPQESLLSIFRPMLHCQ